MSPAQSGSLPPTQPLVLRGSQEPDAVQGARDCHSLGTRAAETGCLAPRPGLWDSPG